MSQGSTEHVLKSIIEAGWGVKSDGHVGASTGYFAVVEIPANNHERLIMRDAVFPDDLHEAAAFDDVPAGWYFVVQDAKGNISYSEDSQAVVDNMFEAALSVYFS
jgi:hypothetical protein